MKSSVQEMRLHFCSSQIYFLFEHTFHWVEEKVLANSDFARSESKLRVGSLQYTKTLREGASGPRLSHCLHLWCCFCPRHVQSSTWGLRPSGPHCKLSLGDISLSLSQLLPFPWGMEDPEGSKDWDSLASLQHHPGNARKYEAMLSYLCLDILSSHVHCIAPLPCHALQASLRHALFLTPP